MLLNESDFSCLIDIVDVKLYNLVIKWLINVGILVSFVNFLILLKLGKIFLNESYVEVGFELIFCFISFFSNGICKLREFFLFNCLECFGIIFLKFFIFVVYGLINGS